MTSERFEQLIDQLETESLKTLKEKNRKYTSKSGDALHNFRTGAAIDGSTMPQTIWHYWKKHFISLLDKIQEDNWQDKDDALEKIQDSINYLRFIWCAINDVCEDTYIIDMGDNQKEIINFAKDPFFDQAYNTCNDCQSGYLVDDDKNWNDNGDRMITEPCASCKGNFSIFDKEFATAKNNFKPIKKEKEEEGF